MLSSRARKERRKLPFLKALARIGTISGAARASRISRDAVYDWLRADPSFSREFQSAKRCHEKEPFEVVHASVGFFKDVIHPIIPVDLWPKVVVELALAVTHLENDLKEGRHVMAAPSEEMAEVSLTPRRVLDVAIPIRVRDASAKISWNPR
jgi:hypothetical protein